MDFDNTEYLTVETEAELFGRFAPDSFGNFTRVTYQHYSAVEDKNPVPHVACNASVNIRSDAHNPGFVLVSLEWKSCTDPYMEKLVRDLITFDKNVEVYPQKDWIFYINISKVELGKGDKDTLLMAHIANPVMWCLSRKAPSQLSAETEVSGELYGGNVVKLVISAENFEVEEDNEADLTSIKSEILRDIDGENFS